MDELDQNINEIAGIVLSRNTPVALVVGAGSFLGSSIVDRFLSKNIQVIGMEDEAYDKKLNLSEAVSDKHFHLLSDLSKLDQLKLERLDYIIIIPKQKQRLEETFKLFKKRKSRLLLLSSVELYSEKGKIKFDWLKEIESKIASVAKENNLNARVLRLGPVFGPRMDFETNLGELDPVARLIAQNLRGELQREISMEFSSRAIFIDDAVDLAIKCILAGATAQKIFDGVAPTPFKISEIKQILLDPLWHENRDFKPTELPPWPTPNLVKTSIFLNWHPRVKLVESLKKTINFFKDNEIEVPKLAEIQEEEKEQEESSEKGEWTAEKAEALKVLKGEQSEKKEKVEEKQSKKFPFLTSIFIIMSVLLVGYSLILPIVIMGWGVLTFRYQLTEAVKNLEKGNFEKSLFSVDQAVAGVEQAKSIFHSLEPIRKAGLLEPQFEIGEKFSLLATHSSFAAKNTVLGIQSLYQSLTAVTGERGDLPKQYFDQSQTYLAAADDDVSKAQALIGSDDFKSRVPEILKSRINSLAERLKEYSSLIKKSRSLSILLPEVVGEKGTKNYLVLLQNNMELRPTGGFIGSFAKVSFEDGKLKKLEVNDIYAIDGQLKIHVEPPKEIAQDLGQKDYFLRDSNWEPDFPTAARQAEWFYNKETGQRVEGVVALDITAMGDLLKVLGSLDLPDYNEKITSENLFEKAISHAEVNFFPGSQAKKSFLTSLAQGLFNKLFFLPNQNWPAIISSLGKSLETKHMSIYLDNQKLFSFLVSQNWASLMPRPALEEKGRLVDFLAPVEANLGANKVNYYLDRIYKLDTIIGKDGEVSHKFKISYTNRSPSDVFPGGKYKNRMRIYLPSGAKITKASWGESNILPSGTSFIDYGRSGYSFLLELLPKEQKTLILEYQIPQKLKFEDDKARYRLDVIKQAGTLKDSFEWNIFYPINLKISSSNLSNLGPQQQTITTDLSTDRSFEVEFSK